jgi:hypothetical protein
LPVKKAPQPWEPAPYDDEGVITASIKALAAGNANEGQQRRALEWIVRSVCGTYDLSFRPDSERATAFAEGKRFVGLQIIKHTKLTTSAKRAKKS